MSVSKKTHALFKFSSDNEIIGVIKAITWIKFDQIRY